MACRISHFKKKFGVKITNERIFRKNRGNRLPRPGTGGFQSCCMRAHTFPCFLCGFRHFFFVPAINNEKKGLPLCIFSCICNRFLIDGQPSARWPDPCLPPAWEQGAGGCKSKGWCMARCNCLSLSVIVCFPHPPLRGPPRCNYWGSCTVKFSFGE